jgi:hypothetical protein
MFTTAQQDVIIIAALVRMSHQFEDADPVIADECWKLATDFADLHGITPADAIFQIELSDSP